MTEIAAERKAGLLHATCLICEAKCHVPDKGIGRANLAAWKTRHQHTDRPSAKEQP